MCNRIILLLLCCCIAVPFMGYAQGRHTRAESFLGFHFDFHATAADQGIGKDFDTTSLADFLHRTKPDYIQIDSKGHPGYSSYPTKIGYSANSFVNDPMRIWRDITNRYHIPLYVHYSGLLDEKAIKENPEWAKINADGTKDLSKAAMLGDYSSKLMIPQIKEMIDNYGIDGVWIDGDCWVTTPDYSPAVVNGFVHTTGIKEVPLEPSDANYGKWLDYNRLIFRKYVKNYVDALHHYKPGFQVASNWAYSSMMPEQVDVNVDFLSGDVSGRNCVYSAAFQSRCLALQGKPWDLMAWGFVSMDFSGGIHSPKSLVQLEQEAAEVMAVGGGFQIYFQQNRDASFQNTIDTGAMAKLAAFCRERQPYCQHSKIIPQIGMWYSVEGWKKDNAGVYGWSSNMEGINSLLMDGQHAVEILMDHHMRDKMEQYPVIIIPEWDDFNRELKARLLKYVESGGNLFVIGSKAVKSFEPYLGVTFEGEAGAAQFNIGDPDLGGVTGISTEWQRVIPGQGTHVIGHVYHQRDYRLQTPYAVASVTPYGKGKIAGLYMNMSASYKTTRHPVYNRVVNKVIDSLYPDATLRVTGSDKIHVVLGKKESSVMVHLINTNGAHSNSTVMSYDTISPSNPLRVFLKVDQKPKCVKLQPDSRKLKFSYRKHEGKIEVLVSPVPVHSIVEVVNQ
ncbi:MAG: alpha-L-fucosidase [Mangrovibacterium sp.]